jgi:ribosomal protein S18 acetylase RimI-like enzyme
MKMRDVMKENLFSWREEPQSSDVESIRKIVGSTDFFSLEERSIAVELAEERLLKGLSSGYYFLFAEEHKNMIGYACFGPIPATRDSFDLYWIAVRNDQRGFGLGKAILGKAEQKIGALGGKKIYVETSSRDQYKSTQAFYRTCGYKKEAVLPDFYSLGDDKIIYVKTLSPRKISGTVRTQMRGYGGTLNDRQTGRA